VISVDASIASVHFSIQKYANGSMFITLLARPLYVLGAVSILFSVQLQVIPLPNHFSKRCVHIGFNFICSRQSGITMRTVKQVTNREVLFGGEEHSGWLPPNAPTPRPTPIRHAILDIRILSDSSGYILEWASQNTDDIGDTWHETIQDAEQQAETLFGVQANEWREIAHHNA
jgi:hypothetical protein